MTADHPLLAVDLRDGALLLGVVLITTSLLMRGWRRLAASRKNSADFRVAVPKQLERRSQPLIDAPPEVARWQVEMHELARDLSAQLDSKLVAVEALLRQTEAASSKLESLLAEARAASQENPVVSQDPPPP